MKLHVGPIEVHMNEFITRRGLKSPASARFYAIEVDSRPVNLSTIERSPPPRDWTPRSPTRQPEDGLRAGPFELRRLGNFPFGRKARLQGSPREGPESARKRARSGLTESEGFPKGRESD
jgi:hypothetical protein